MKFDKTVQAEFEGKDAWFDIIEWDVQHEEADGYGWVQLSIGFTLGTFHLKFTPDDADEFLEEFREEAMLAKAVERNHCNEESEV